jgi:hypothetical protein
LVFYAFFPFLFVKDTQLMNGNRPVMVIGSMGLSPALIERLRQLDDLEIKLVADVAISDILEFEPGYARGLVQAIQHQQQREWNPFRESYWDNFITLRRKEVNGHTRIPPKKATCSSRRKGRRFKG